MRKSNFRRRVNIFHILGSFCKYLISEVRRRIEAKEAYLKKELQFYLEEGDSWKSVEWTVPSLESEHWRYLAETEIRYYFV